MHAILMKEIIPEKVDLIVCDVSFISMKKVIFPSLRFLDNNMGSILALIKPQFESEKKYLKKGIIKDPEIHNKICSEFKVWFQEECRMKVKGIIESPIKGPKGNKEFLIYAVRD